MGGIRYKELYDMGTDYFQTKDIDYIIKNINEWLDTLDHILTLEEFSKINPEKTIQICNRIIKIYENFAFIDNRGKSYIPIVPPNLVNYNYIQKTNIIGEKCHPLYHIFRIKAIAERNKNVKQLILYGVEKFIDSLPYKWVGIIFTSTVFMYYILSIINLCKGLI